MKKLSLFIIALIATMGITVAQAQTVSSVKYSWSAPTAGSPVVEYSVEVRIDGGEWVSHGVTLIPEYIFSNEFEYFKSYEIRVAGVDIVGRQGPFSLASEPYMPDLGPPGTPGTPFLIEVIE